ncbi:MAG: DNA polymerase III subunit chi [Parachlamydiales bacterium]|nr:DNA polymerase III subunit chi [Parachlamydiales bacterium]
MEKNSKIIFLQIRIVRMKLQKIVHAAHYHFQKKEPLLFLVQDDMAAKYVDHLLWQLPEESFLPHVITNSPAKDLIVISSKKKNLNGASHFFNLTDAPLFFEESVTVYEFEDYTHPSKIKIFQQKYNDYKAKNFAIESRA